MSYKQAERTETGYFHFVDLPGYGYAKVSKAQRNVWRTFIEGYFHRSLFLRGTVLLVDIRHEPQALDLQMAEWLQGLGQCALVVATKADKLSKNQAQKSLVKIREAYNSFAVDDIVPCSSQTGAGFPQVVDWIERKIAPCSNKSILHK